MSGSNETPLIRCFYADSRAAYFPRRCLLASVTLRAPASGSLSSLGFIVCGDQFFSNLLRFGFWLGLFIHGLDWAVGFRLLLLLLLSLDVVLGQVAVLAHSARVVRSLRVTAGVSHLALPSPVVTVVAHVFGVVHAVCVRA